MILFVWELTFMKQKTSIPIELERNGLGFILSIFFLIFVSFQRDKFIPNIARLVNSVNYFNNYYFIR